MDHRDQKGTRSVEREKSRPDAPGDAHHPLRIRRRGCVLLVLLAAGGCNPAPDPPAPGTTITPASDGVVPIEAEPVKPISYGTEVFRQPINAFVLVEEEAERVAMHMPSRWIHLSFDTPDWGVNVTLTDDGAKLYVSAQSSECFSTVHPLQYEGSEDESGLYADMAAALERLVDSCGERIAGAGRYLGLLERAEPGFPEAMRAMKARVSRAFGRSMERCRPPDRDEFRDPNHPCS